VVFLRISAIKHISMKRKKRIRTNLKSYKVSDFPAISLLSVLFIAAFLVSCTNKKNNEKTLYKSLNQKESIVAPVSIKIKDPIIVNTDTGPKSTSFTISENLKKIPANFVTYMQNFSTEQGLSYSSISRGDKSSICDKIGNLWFGTAGGGVSRYDGKSFTTFTTDQGLADNYIYCITEDKAGNLWFGTENGVSCYDGESFSQFTTDQGLASNFVYCIMQDKAGNLLFGTENGISVYNAKSVKNKSRTGSFRKFLSAKALDNKKIFSIIEDKSGNYWFGTNKGDILRFNGKTLTYFTAGQGIDIKCVNCITEDKKGILWFGTSSGVFSYDGSTFTNYTTSQGLIDNEVYCITEDTKENLWFGTANGLTRYRPDSKTGAFTNFTMAQGLPNNCIYSITLDKTGNLWFGTFGGGISRYEGETVSNSTTDQGLVNNIVWSIYEDKTGDLWFGTGNGLSRYDGEYYTNFKIPSQPINNEINSIIEDKADILWIGTNNGAFRKNGLSFTHYTTAQGLIDNLILNILSDKAGNLWFGTGKGLSRFDGKSFVNYGIAQGLVNDFIYCLTEDKNSNLWIGTPSGVSRYDGKSFTNYTTAQGLPNNTVLSIREDQAGFLWFGTAGGGISRFDGKTFLTFSVVEGLADNNVNAIVQDKKGTIWVGTNKGLSGLFFQIPDIHNSSVKKIIPAGRLNTSNENLKNYLPVWEIYNSYTGYPLKDVNGGCNNGTMLCDSKGIIWVGVGNDKTALVRFDHNSVLKNKQPLTLVLQSLKVNNENICWHMLMNEDRCGTDKNCMGYQSEELLSFTNTFSDKELITMLRKFGDIKFDSISRFYPIPHNLILPYEHNNLTFEFNAVLPTRHSLVRYQYMLDGYDRDWSPLTWRTSATYGNIYEGTHTFMVRALSPEGVWGSPISYTFKVLPPWYRTWWFYSIFIVCILVLVYLIYYVRLSYYRRHDAELSELVKERTSELENTNDLLVEKQNLIKLQSRELQEKNKQLLASNSSKDKFFSIIAHDLRNPFHTLMGFSDVLIHNLENYSLDDAREILNMIYSTSKKGSDLLENLLLWSRTETGRMPYEPISINLSAIVESNILFMEAQGQMKNIRITKEIDPSILVMADENMLNTILRNLISNAIKFTYENGLIVVKASVVKPNAEISVCDNGVGISEENRNKLFQFETNISTQGTSSESGTGLGLILCKEFVEKHGGKIWVESEKNKGSEFKFTLPTIPNGIG